MKATQILFGAMVTVLSVSAFAQSTVKTEAERDQANLNARNNYPVIKFESTKTRADVVAELEAARLGKPASTTSVKPDVAGSPTQSKAFDSSLYNGA
ncbi:DUF4148 domain-containing protein [Herbaspirillum huttiense]|uniref:DUF4148 domain-containing protein n=1 Tax=Herbaspirillum TaxID=963 RepID=UPI001065943E|nr:MULTISPECIES: DUF4148 domain-containing protein [Herbaspirillum]MCI1016744.1 DUF4148 domain-containing protein [Herbaspirillum sp. C7C2]QBP73601.1 DUF4148 domain-containing protein [Herbaspirillum huttiense]